MAPKKRAPRARRATRRVAAPAQPAAAPSTNGRTEEEKVLQWPVKVVLGGETYEIKPLTISESRKWREAHSKPLAGFTTLSTVTDDDKQGFLTALTTVVLALSDEMVDMFFGYAKDLDRKAIEDAATEVELSAALDALMMVAFPLLQNLTTVTDRVMGSR